MAGEKLERAHLGQFGIEGDRIVHVENARGRVVTARTHPRFSGHKSVLGQTGEPLVDGKPWNSPEVAAMVVDIAGRGAKLVQYEGEERFDVLPLLIATDGAILAALSEPQRQRDTAPYRTVFRHRMSKQPFLPGPPNSQEVMR